MTPLLEACRIELSGRLRPTNLTCPQPQMIAVIGPNGAGKTSLLRALAEIELTAGFVRVRGEDLKQAPPVRRLRLLSFLPATRGLIWPIAARDVISLGLPSSDPARVDELIELLELASLAHRPVNQLSTGERSRVLLARALAARPRMLLLDEPLSNLDPYWVLRTLEILRKAVTADDCAVIASLHDLGQIGAFDRVVLVAGGEIVADGPPMEILSSAELSRAFRIEIEGSGWRISANA